ncbi:MAG: hypothetical protein EOP91_14465 [Lysobacteraceae bacterium]|nr:MAG: hypothetical protein EOP91_14465 [Xanthomonadaceae bacterium]
MTAPLTLDSVLKHMQGLNGQLQQLEAEKQQQLKDELMRKQLLKALDDPRTRSALRAQLELTRNQIDALALQLDTQREAVTTARARVQKALDKLDKPASLSETLASRLSELSDRASSSFRSVGVAATHLGSAPAPATAKRDRKTSTAAKKSAAGRKPTR